MSEGRERDVFGQFMSANQVDASDTHIRRIGLAVEIVDERTRQICGEGFSFAHDDAHTKGELARAAACYAEFAAEPDDRRADMAARLVAGKWCPRRWPWAFSWWKPRDRRRDLVRAAALILAEIERLDRAAGKK